MKKVLTLIIFLSLLFSVSTVLAQSITVKTYGQSQRDVALDSTDIFDRASNGLLNVGIETQMYLKATISEGTLSGGSWMISEKPAGSVAAFGNSVVDSVSQVIVFTPDVVGKYVIEFIDGSLADTVTINAGMFMGAEAGQCLLCHSDKAAEWQDTRHASKLTRGVQGLVSSYYNEGCIGCHTVGYDANANNGGFDDFEFVFPDSLYIGADEDLATAYPDAWARANIQCESCHGPGSEHFGNKADNRIAKTIETDNCAMCHDAGTHHVFPEQWDQSGHANPPTYPTGPSRASCARCHTPEGFMEYVAGEEVTAHDWAPFSCSMCHDPHSNFGEDGLTSDRHQLRLNDPVLGNGFVVENGGNGKICMNCHQNRRDSEDYTKAQLTGDSGHFGPHYMTQADMINAKNANTFGYELPSSPHLVAVENSCAHCHMDGSNGKVDAEGNVQMVGQHTYSVTNLNTGEENVGICAECHGELESFDEKKYYDSNYNADHDGDGVEEGLHEEVEGMMEELAVLLPHADSTAGYDAHDNVTPEFTVAELKAAFNYEMVYYDHSHGIHNPAFTVALLKVSIEALKYGTITAGLIQSVTDVPMDQGYQVRVVWTKFGADDGVAPDQVKEYTVLRHVNDMAPKGVTAYGSISEMPADLAIGSSFVLEGDLWDIVAAVPAIQFGEYSAVVPTLYNTVGADTAWATFKVLGKTEGGIIAETEPMSGYSTDDMAPLPPTGLAASVTETGVQLNWNEAYDKDVENFDVYRSVDTDFNIETAEYLGSTRALTFTDASPMGDMIYYSITAVDYSKNVSENAAPVGVVITAIAEDMGVPTEFELFANYPNPFNPSTQIKFGLPQSSDVRLTVYDAVGKEVATIVNEKLSAGYHVYTWNATNNASGIYFYQIQTNSFVQVKKMVLVK